MKTDRKNITTKFHTSHSNTPTLLYLSESTTGDANAATTDVAKFSGHNENLYNRGGGSRLDSC